MGDFLDLNNKHILVTGASSGIGKATAILISKHGAKVSIIGRRENALQDTLSNMCGKNNRSFILDFDIYSNKCVSCEGYLLVDKKTKSENIVIEKFSNGELLIELEDFEKEVPINEYLLNSKIKYDTNKSRICIGDINSNEVIMFGKGQYASFKNDKLIGIIIDLK